MTTVRRKANIEACERKHRGFCEYNRTTNHTSRPIHACSYRLPKHKKSTIFLKLVAEWLACWTRVQKARVQIAVATLSGNSLRQTVHTHRASIHQAAKLVTTLLRIAGVTAGLAESNGSIPSGLWFTSPEADCQEPGSATEPYAR